MFLLQRTKLALYLAIICSIATTAIDAASVETVQHTEKPLDFIKVAKEAIPAVVSIEVQAARKKGSNKAGKSNSWDLDDDSLEARGRQFLEKFFNFYFDDTPSEPSAGQASGFIVSPDGYIITNNHVVQDFEEIVVTLDDGTEYPGKLIGQDNNTDIALIKIEGKNLPYLKFGNSDALQVGQWIMAIGTPLGLQATVTVGVVSAKGRNNLALARIEDFIQTDAAINRGNSGGPMLNLAGEVVGINTAIASSMGGSMGIGFAVPSNIAKNVMEQLINTGSVSRSFLGIELQLVDHNLASAFGLEKPEGALIAQVLKDSPAEKGGLKQGDIITKLNGTRISAVGGFRTAIALMAPGTKINLSLLRDGKPVEITLATGDFSSNDKAKVEEKVTQNDKLGLTVMTLTPELSRKLGIQEVTGVVITQVEPNSMAQLAGLRKGSLILAINQKKVASVEQFKQALSNIDKKKPVLFLIKDGGSVRFVSIKAEE